MSRLSPGGPASPISPTNPAGHVSLFVSAVSSEFAPAREVLRHELAGPQVDLQIQEDFIAAGTTTLRKLDDYIRHCHAVIHLVGARTGAPAHPQALADLRTDHPDLATKLPMLADSLADGAPALSYTQWEAWLALYHGKTLLICVPDDAARGTAAADAADATQEPTEDATPDAAQRAAQQAHLQRLEAAGHYPQIRFSDATQLALRLRNAAILGRLLDAAGARPPPRRLPWRSLGPLFAGRADEIAALRDAFGAPPTRTTPVVAQVLHGVGGVGKTRLAVEYAWQHADDYRAILFISASEPSVLASHFTALCAPDVLDLPEWHASEPAQQRAAVQRWLNAHPGWLLIIDELDDDAAAQAAEALLPPLTGGHILLTSRLAHWSGELTARALPTLPPAAARDFLLQRTRNRRRTRADDTAKAAELAEELGHLALALEQAAAYIATTRQTLADYLADWRQNDHDRRAALAWYDPRLMHYPKSVAQTWQTTFDRLSDTARELLCMLAWLAPEAIPESLLDTPAAGAADDDAARVQARTMRGALTELDGYSLVHRADDNASVRLHRLVQTVSRDQQHDDARHATDDRVPPALRAALVWLDDAFVGDPGDVRNWPRLDPLAPHAQAVAGFADQAAIAEPTARLFNNTALLLQAQARYGDAEPLLRRALVIDEASLGREHPTVAIHLNNLASLLQATNRLADAEPLMRRALAITEASLGREHPGVAIGLNNLASLLQDTNRLADAEPLLRRALAIDEASLGIEHPNVARDLNNLARLLQATNRLADVEPLLRRALAITEASLGGEHPTVAIGLSNLAILLQKTNRLADAEPLMRRALAIDEASLGREHPSVAIDLNNLATLLQDTNRLADAEPLLRRALAIDEASLGREHPSVARDLNNLAQLLQATNRLAEAEPLMRRALAIDEASLGREHPSVAIRLNNLAQLLQDTNRLADAEPLLRRALAIDEASLGSEHPSVAIGFNNLAQLLQATNRLADAEPLLRRALAIDEASLGREHPNVACDLNNLAGLLQATNRLADAEPLLRRALAIDEASLGREHPDVARDLNNLALLLQDTNRLADAEPLLRRALRILFVSLGEHPHTQIAFGNAVGLLHALGRSDDEIVATLAAWLAD